MELSPHVRFSNLRRSRESYREFLAAYDYRLFFVTEGSLQVMFSRESVTLSQGALLLFPPGTPYRLVFNGEAEYYILNFDPEKGGDAPAKAPEPLAAFDAAGVLCRVHPMFPGVLHAPDAAFAQSILRRIDREFVRREPYWQPIAAAALQELLLRLCRGQRRTPEGSPAARAREYLAGNWNRPVTNGEVAAALHFHPVYLNRAFHAAYGVSMQEWLCALRLDRACAMLSGTELPVGEIAEACGFASATWFIRRFKAQYGITPLQYRKQR